MQHFRLNLLQNVKLKCICWPSIDFVPAVHTQFNKLHEPPVSFKSFQEFDKGMQGIMHFSLQIQRAASQTGVPFHQFISLISVFHKG